MTVNKVSVVEMRMIGWMSGLNGEDRIKNNLVRGNIGVPSRVKSEQNER